MSNVIEARYPVTMQYQMEMKAYERNPKFGVKGEAPMVKADMAERTFFTTTLRINIEAVLLHFVDRNYVHYHELIEELKKRKLRSFEFHEHLAFNMKYPKEAAEFTIVSFGSPLHLNSSMGADFESFKNGISTGPYPGAYPNLRWDLHVPRKEDFFSTSGSPKFYFGCVPL